MTFQGSQRLLRITNASGFTQDLHTHTNRMESTPRRAIEEARELDRAIQDEGARADAAAPSS